MGCDCEISSETRRSAGDAPLSLASRQPAESPELPRELTPDSPPKVPPPPRPRTTKAVPNRRAIHRTRRHAHRPTLPPLSPDCRCGCVRNGQSVSSVGSNRVWPATIERGAADEQWPPWQPSFDWRPRQGVLSSRSAVGSSPRSPLRAKADARRGIKQGLLEPPLNLLVAPPSMQACGVSSTL